MLTEKIQFCKRCLYSNQHPFGITFDHFGICSGCRVHEEKDSLDWKFRWAKLEKIVNDYKCKNGKNYDCIVPVTGANDSYFILHIVKNIIGLNPLLVTYNKYFNTQLGIRNLANLRIKFNCDILIQNVNPLTVKKITKSTLRRFGSIYWPILSGSTVFPVQTAVKYKIPLIIWGAHQGTEQVGMFSYEHEVEMTRRYRKDHDLMGMEADDLISPFDTIREEDIWQYRYPSDSDLHAIGVRGIYLSNFVRWDIKQQQEDMIKLYDFKTSKFNRTFDTYDHTDCYNYMGLHDLLKFYKLGYSKVTDHASREIRFGRITRNQGINFVQNYEKNTTPNLELFCDWLGLNSQALNLVIDQFKNPNFWTEKENKIWEVKSLSDMMVDFDSSNDESNINFISSSELNMGKEDRYIIIGKGFP